MPCWEQFERQTAEYRELVLPRAVVEAAIAWASAAEQSIAVDRQSGNGIACIVGAGAGHEHLDVRGLYSVMEFRRRGNAGRTGGAWVWLVPGGVGLLFLLLHGGDVVLGGAHDGSEDEYALG